MTLGRLQDSTMQKIDAHGTSFWAASHRGGKDGSALGLLERQRVKTWLHRAYERSAVSIHEGPGLGLGALGRNLE